MIVLGSAFSLASPRSLPDGDWWYYCRWIWTKNERPRPDSGPGYICQQHRRGLKTEKHLLLTAGRSSPAPGLRPAERPRRPAALLQLLVVFHSYIIYVYVDEYVTDRTIGEGIPFGGGVVMVRGWFFVIARRGSFILSGRSFFSVGCHHRRFSLPSSPALRHRLRWRACSFCTC